MGTWVRHAEGGCAVEVRVTPRSSRAGVRIREGIVVVRVHAPPVGGRATREAVRLLAAALDVPPSTIALGRGARSRRKVFLVAGIAPQEAERRLARAAGDA